MIWQAVAAVSRWGFENFAEMECQDSQITSAHAHTQDADGDSRLSDDILRASLSGSGAAWFLHLPDAGTRDQQSPCCAAAGDQNEKVEEYGSSFETGEQERDYRRRATRKAHGFSYPGPVSLRGQPGSGARSLGGLELAEACQGLLAVNQHEVKGILGTRGFCFSHLVGAAICTTGGQALILFLAQWFQPDGVLRVSRHHRAPKVNDIDNSWCLDGRE